MLNETPRAFSYYTQSSWLGTARITHEILLGNWNCGGGVESEERKWEGSTFAGLTAFPPRAEHTQSTTLDAVTPEAAGTPAAK